MPEQIPDAVERMVSVYNAGDLDGFLLCFSEDVVVEDEDGTSCRPAARHCGRHTAGFSPSSPTGSTRSQPASGSARGVVDEERVTGGPRGEVRAIAIYHLDSDDLIDRARFLT